LGKPFKDREEVKADIRMCDYAAAVCSIVGIILAAIGVIGDALDIALILEPNSWLLLAIFAGLGAMMTHLNYLMARHLYGIESERKKE